MGHLVNAKGFRVGKSWPWNFRSHRFDFDKLRYILIYTTLEKYIHRLFMRLAFKARLGWIFSNIDVAHYHKKFIIIVFLFNAYWDAYTRSQFGFLKYHRRNKLLTDFAKRGIYKLTTTLNHWVMHPKWLHPHRKIGSTTYQALERYISYRVNYDFRNVFRKNLIPTCHVKSFHYRYGNIPAAVLANYIIERVRLNYRLSSIVYPLINETKKQPGFKGIFFKFTGRWNRKPRVIVNKKTYKYGKIGFSTVCARVDYAFRRFETKFGTCSVKVWVCRD
jgi:hypothetical protein